MATWKKILIVVTILVVLSLGLVAYYYFVVKESCLNVITMEEGIEHYLETGEHYSSKTNSLYFDDDFYDNSCEVDMYECNDFCTQGDAQKVFDECNIYGLDVHNLDSDNDGIACESLP